LAFHSASSLKANQLKAKKEKLKKWLKGWFSLSCLLGVQWIIGYVYVDGSTVFDYVFTALNCSQGILIFIFHCVLRNRTRQILLGRLSTEKSSGMINSVYGQLTLAQQKERLARQNRQSKMSSDTSTTALSTPSPASSEYESSPSSERSQTSSEGSMKRLCKQTSGRQLTRQRSRSSEPPDSGAAGSQRGRANPAFQMEDALPYISEESESGAARLEQRPSVLRGSRGSPPAPVTHTDSVEIYRSHNIGHSHHNMGALRHGKLH